MANLSKVERVLGVDANWEAVNACRQRLRNLTSAQAALIDVLHLSITARDERLLGFDAAILVEVIEHLAENELHAAMCNVLGYMCPTTVVLTTPNREYNVLLPEGNTRLRHPDHRFEWTRAEFSRWARACGERFGYSLRMLGAGKPHGKYGSPTQIGLFRKM